MHSFDMTDASVPSRFSFCTHGKSLCTEAYFSPKRYRLLLNCLFMEYEYFKFATLGAARKGMPGVVDKEEHGALGGAPDQVIHYSPPLHYTWPLIFGCRTNKNVQRNISTKKLCPSNLSFLSVPANGAKGAPRKVSTRTKIHSRWFR